MVSSTAILAMIIEAGICFLLPIVVFLYLRKKEDLSFKPFFIGMIIFFVFTQILEQGLHFLVLGNGMIKSPIIFAIYGALAAGIFEEVGRFFAFKTVLKKEHEWKDGIAYGLGHGGIEAMLVGGFGYIKIIIYCFMINNGTFDTALGSSFSGEQLSQLKESLIQLGAFSNVTGVVERIFALGLHVGFSMIVLYAIRYRKNIFLFVAILLHAAVDMPAGLFKGGIITNIYVIEGLVAIEFVIAMIFLFKSKKIFSKEECVTQETSSFK